jgi:hypothetical protein
MAQGWGKFYEHGKQDKKAEEIEIKRQSEGHTRCPMCGCGSFSSRIKKGLLYRTCTNEPCSFELEPIE